MNHYETAVPKTELPELVNHGAVPVVPANEIGAASAVAREQAEIQAAIIMAQRYPRNEMDAFVRAANSFKRLTMADNAEYSFKRGKRQDEDGKWVDNKVAGPSIYAARELARIWKHVRYGIRILLIDERYVHLKGWAWDLEANNYVEMEDKFQKLIQRKGRDGETSWRTPDERDLRELINRRGAIAVRNCILQILPEDLKEDTLAVANDTLTKHAKKELADNLDTTLRRLCMTFDRYAVTVEMLEGFLGHPLKNISPAELSDLRKIANSIKDGNSTREEHFEMPGGTVSSKKAEAVDKKAEEIRDSLGIPKEEGKK